MTVDTARRAAVNRQYTYPQGKVCLWQCALKARNHLWRKNPPRELSIDLVADERLGRVTGRAGASCGVSFGQIEASGVGAWLAGLRPWMYRRPSSTAS